MTTFRPKTLTGKPRQKGAALVEFAFVAILFFTLLLGIFEFGRLFFTWNSAVEATRRAARLAVVCNKDSATIKTQFRAVLPSVAAADINVVYSPSGCTGANDCEAVTVSISPNAPAMQFVIPFMSASWRLPGFSTTLTKESLSNGSGSDANPDC